VPSALETLVKILKLEREQGCNNTAVIGGLAAFSQNWVKDARTQARKPEHHLLIDELVNLLQHYEQIESRSERHTKIQYMMDRITSRVPAPPEYQVKLQPAPEPPPQASPKPPPQAAVSQPPPERRPKQQPPPQAPPQERRAKPQSAQPPPRERKPKAPERPAKNRPDRSRFRDRDDDESAPSPLDDRYVSEDRGNFYRGNGFKPTGQLDIPAQPRLARPPRTPRTPIDPQDAADIMHGLRKPVSVIKGVGDRMAGLFAKLGVHTVNDLLNFLPRAYDDYTRLLPINRLQPKQTVVVIGTVREAEVRAGRGGRKDFQISLDDGSGLMSVVFFGQHYLSRDIKAGHQIVLRGETSLFNGRVQMSSPTWEHLDPDNLVKLSIVPVYPLTQNLKAQGLRRLMKNAVEYWADRLPDYIPSTTLDRAELADLGWAIKNIHFPAGWDHLTHARNRIVFDSLLLLQLAILGNRREWQSQPAESLNVTDEFMETFLQTVFPYEMTRAQRRAIDDIRRDIAKPIPMNRLLQGDVGSGKTAVAIAALAMAVASGKQGAIMAPTSILAEQHFRNLARMFEQMPGEKKPVVALLTGALTETERQVAYAGIAEGSIDLIVGTQALIQEGLVFKDLALAIIDEQHRFGTAQRGMLRGKGMNPHLLVMTATPIPRTLALTLHADLDLSIMDEMPPGRIPVKTRMVDVIARERIFNFVEEQLEKGRQAFVVHPLVEQSEKMDTMSAMEAYENLSKIFYRYKVGLLHGRMRPSEKDEVMSAFSQGYYQLLVTTSVAEVGVDVPNASVIVIEGANRFGLAQLHQFRGRVGRGEHASYCLLILDQDQADSLQLLREMENTPDPGERANLEANLPEAIKRLKAMEDSNDGFHLAEIDWKLRGAGDLLGTRQSGRSLTKLGEFITPQLVELAQREARTIYEEDPDLTLEPHRLLAQRVQILKDERSDVS
jgi:ATP-dependent DNA helicase RecG